MEMQLAICGNSLLIANQSNGCDDLSHAHFMQHEPLVFLTLRSMRGNVAMCGYFQIKNSLITAETNKNGSFLRLQEAFVRFKQRAPSFFI